MMTRVSQKVSRFSFARKRMPRKRASTGIPARPVLDTAADRFVWMLEHRWKGNQSAMARDLGCQQSVISKVVRGKHFPGFELLHKLAAQPGLNADWVLAGHGDPFPQTAASVWSELLLPIARTPLPGPEIQERAAFSGSFHPVRPSMFSKCRYFLEVQPNSPATIDPNVKLCPGDLLLVETQPVWQVDPALLSGRICLIRRAFEGVSTISLGRVESSYGAEGKLFDCPIKYLGRDEPARRSRRAIRFLDSPPNKPERQEPDTRTSIHNIVGLVLEMVRPVP